MSLRIFCDGANLSDFEKYADDVRVQGFTTNPSILKKAGITDYRAFAKTVLSLVKGKPVSFEVLSDDFNEMERQSNEIQSWGENCYVKIPITNTLGDSSKELIERLRGLNLNVTAVMSRGQVEHIWPVLQPNHILSIFVGRINDAGYPVPDFVTGREFLTDSSEGAPQVLWASTRQVYSVIEAEQKGYDIITMTPDLISKRSLHGKDLMSFSLETVNMFYNHGKGLSL